MYIKELKLSGIRSFSHLEETGLSISNISSLHKILLSKGVNLIYGNTGTGKTTFIESAKYGVTGKHPFSPDELASFISHQKQPLNSQVKGQIQLTIVTPDGNEVHIDWEMCKRRNNAKPTPCLTITRHGSNPMTSEKPQEIKVMLFNLLQPQVRPVVWEYVIMVPQEESLWPFNIPSKEKDIFDDIFDLKTRSAEEFHLRETIKKLLKDIQDQDHDLALATDRFTEYNKQVNQEKLTLTDRAKFDMDFKLQTVKKDDLDAQLKKLNQELELIHQMEHHRKKLTDLNLSAANYADLDVSAMRQKKDTINRRLEGVLVDLGNLQREKKNAETELQQFREKLCNIRGDIKNSERASKDICSLLLGISINPNDDITTTDYQIDSQISSNEAKCKEYERRKIKNTLELNREEILNSQVQATQSQELQNNGCGDNFRKIPISAWGLLLEFLMVQKNKAADFCKEREELCTADTNNEALIDQLHRIDDEIVIIERLNAKKEAYSEIIRSFSENFVCQECSSQEARPIQRLKQNLAQLNTDLSDLKSKDELLKQKAVVLQLLQKEGSIKDCSHFVEEMDKVTSQADQIIYVSTSDILNTESQTAEYGLNQNPSNSAQLPKPPKIPRVSDLQDVGTKGATICPEYSLRAAEEQADLLREKETVIKLLKSKTQVFRDVKVRLDELRKHERPNGIADLQASEERYKQQIDNFDATVKATETGIQALQKEELHLNVDTQKVLSSIESFEELNKTRNQLELLGFNPDLVLQTLDGTKVRQKEMEQSFKTAEMDCTILRNKVAKQTGELESIRRQLSTTLRNAPAEYEACRSKLAVTKTQLESRRLEAEILREDILGEHQSGLTQINNAIQANWSEMYPHDNSIDLIKLRSDIKNETDKRIQYTYHFDMTPSRFHNVMKMRGSSSLGERYWVSAMVRCAMADLYAPNCPIFGFDAPEVNLDSHVVDHLIKLFQKLANDGKQLIITSASSEFLDQIKSAMTGSSIPLISYVLQKQNGSSSVVPV